MPEDCWFWRSGWFSLREFLCARYCIYPPSPSPPPFVSDDEVQKITKQVRESGTPNYIEEVTKSIEIQEKTNDDGDDDELYQEAVEFVVESRRASISSIQRKFRIGYNRAARLIETMEDNGIVSTMNSNGSREVL